MLQFDTYYHIYNHANGDDNLFREEKNYPFFLEKYHQHIDPIAETVAWCLMPNHFHLLVKIKSEVEVFDNLSTTSSSSKVRNFGRAKEKDEEVKRKLLSKQFANFFSSYTQAFNKMYSRRGSLFIKNFKRKEVEDESYLQNLILYIHLNPIKHGFVSLISDWIPTSYHTFPTEKQKFLTSVFFNETAYFQQHAEKQRLFEEYQNIENDLK